MESRRNERIGSLWDELGPTDDLREGLLVIGIPCGTEVLFRPGLWP